MTQWSVWRLETYPGSVKTVALDIFVCLLPGFWVMHLFPITFVFFL